MGEVTPLLLGLGSPELLILLVPVVSISLTLWALIDAAMRPNQEWVAAGQSKVLWLSIIVIVAIASCLTLGWLSALLYALVPRREMTRSPGSTA